ncbi:hypothetical protein GUJ93_ZPchr0006g44724 [Zizania palustris]|uniref:Uncharacterized protein n=1 Tax=Zizania palustris TaxID=103762 RepID=A0A8J5VSX7_ZIZPA|nr:hypothetical protein GUJ93_ZPchr0006g44724 [Zizania palustris]
MVEGVGPSCRDQPLLHAEPRVDLLALRSRRRDALPVPRADAVVVVVVMAVMMTVTVVVAIMMVVLLVMICGGCRPRRRGGGGGGGIKGGHCEKHLPAGREVEGRLQRVDPSPTTTAPVEGEGEHGEPQEEDGRGVGVSSSPHGHHAAGWPLATASVMDRTRQPAARHRTRAGVRATGLSNYQQLCRRSRFETREHDRSAHGACTEGRAVHYRQG